MFRPLSRYFDKRSDVDEFRRISTKGFRRYYYVGIECLLCASIFLEETLSSFWSKIRIVKRVAKTEV